MSQDAATQALRRDGGIPLHRILREGHDVLPGYTSARDHACTNAPCEPGTVRCHGCTGVSRVPADPLDTVRLLAFLGHEEARGTVGVNDPVWVGVTATMGTSAEVNSWDEAAPNPRAYVYLLDRLASKLPPHLHAAPCRTCGPYDDAGSLTLRPSALPRCPDCQGTGTAHHDTPAQRWLLVVAAHAAAREIWKTRFEQVNALGQAGRVFSALSTCSDWIEEPTQPNESLWLSSWRAPDWVPANSPGKELLVAARVLGPERLREVVAEALIPRLLP